jgi:hypothetical protein
MVTPSTKALTGQLGERLPIELILQVSNILLTLVLIISRLILGEVFQPTIEATKEGKPQVKQDLGLAEEVETLQAVLDMEPVEVMAEKVAKELMVALLLQVVAQHMAQ